LLATHKESRHCLSPRSVVCTFTGFASFSRFGREYESRERDRERKRGTVVQWPRGRARMSLLVRGDAPATSLTVVITAHLVRPPVQHLVSVPPLARRLLEEPARHNAERAREPAEPQHPHDVVLAAELALATVCEGGDSIEERPGRRAGREAEDARRDDGDKELRQDNAEVVQPKDGPAGAA